MKPYLAVLSLAAMVAVGAITSLATSGTSPGIPTGTTVTLSKGGGHGTPKHQPFPICHATGSQTHPFVYIRNIDVTGVWSGHVQHQDSRDIIGPFTIVDAKGKVVFDFPGQNIATTYNGVTGAELLKNKCKIPVATSTVVITTVTGGKTHTHKGTTTVKGGTTTVYTTTSTVPTTVTLPGTTLQRTTTALATTTTPGTTTPGTTVIQPSTTVFVTTTVVIPSTTTAPATTATQTVTVPTKQGLKKIIKKTVKQQLKLISHRAPHFTG